MTLKIDATHTISVLVCLCSQTKALVNWNQVSHISNFCSLCCISSLFPRDPRTQVSWCLCFSFQIFLGHQDRKIYNQKKIAFASLNNENYIDDTKVSYQN